MRQFSIIKTFFIFCLIILLFSFTSDKTQKKVIRNKEFDIYFYISLKDKRTKKDKTYYWYKSREIHHSFGDSGGDLLHEGFVKYYNGNQLAEKGEFRYGLKKGVWKNWYKNGNLQEITRWRNGARNGWSYLYDTNGTLLLSGKYRNGVKKKLWINHKTNDTTWYKNGVPYKEDPKIIKRREDSIKGKSSFFERLFKKRDSTEKKNKKPFFKRFFGSKKDSIK